MISHDKPMNQHESESDRLARTYSEMSDAGLLDLAADLASLTDVAKRVLIAELSARSLEVPPVLAALPLPAISGPLVMVKRYRDLPEAQVAESLLDSAGIDCFLADENIVRLDWFWSNLVGGFKLMVRPEDLNEATHVIEEANLAGQSNETESDTHSGDTTE